MRTIKMTTGARVPLDGDLLTILETLYREMTARRELERTFEDTVRATVEQYAPALVDKLKWSEMRTPPPFTKTRDVVYR